MYTFYSRTKLKKKNEEEGRRNKQFSRKPMPQDCVLKKAVFHFFFFFFFCASIQNLRGAKWEHSFKYSRCETNGTLSKIQLFQRIWEIKLYLSHSLLLFTNFSLATLIKSLITRYKISPFLSISADTHTHTHTHTSIIIYLNQESKMSRSRYNRLYLTLIYFLRRFN